MRPSNKSRSRKSGGNNPNNQRRNVGNVMNRVYDSAGPDGKVRGTPQQIIDKYQALARDAQLSGDRVIAENYLQHSEHYSRLLGEAMKQQNEQRASQQDRDDDQDSDGQNHGQRQSDHDQQPRQNDRGQQSRQNDHDQQPRGEYGGSQGGERDRDRDRDRNLGSAFATIDPTGEDEVAGPIDTPEGRSEQPVPNGSHGVAPVRSQQEPNGAAAHAEPAAPAAPDGAPTKRPRTRRKAAPAPEDVATQAD